MSASAANRVLEALLDRLYTAVARGPALNAQARTSRQRIDLSLLERLGGSASEALEALVGPEREYIVRAPVRAAAEAPPEREGRKEEEDAARVLRRLYTLAKEADSYQRDTGSPCLYVGYPLVSIPEPGGGRGASTPRVLAPLAFIPVALEVVQGSRATVQLRSVAEAGSDRVIPNVVLKMWFERHTGAKFPALFEDEEGSDPLREVQELLQHVAETLQIASPPALAGWPTARIPEAGQLGREASLIPGAVLGLFPLAKLGAIRDTEALLKTPGLPETVRPFVTLDASLTATADGAYTGDDGAPVALLPAAEEHLVDWADPCQRRAVLRARNTRGLVVHGPPGTGKSQTITNIIGDYLARGKRVLLVCEKRTALDVVMYRLQARGLGHLCAVVHDATKDRTPLYTGIRERLDGLADAPVPADPEHELRRVNQELDSLNAELQQYYAQLSAVEPETGKDFHALMGLWLATAEETALQPLPLDPGLQEVPPALLQGREGLLRAGYRRLLEADLANNGWDRRHGVTLEGFLARSMADVRRALDAAVQGAREARARATPEAPPFLRPGSGAPEPAPDLEAQARWREEVAAELRRLAVLPEEAIRSAVAALAPPAVAESLQALAGLEGHLALVAATPLAPDLASLFNASPWPVVQVATSVAKLTVYLQKVQGFLGFFQFTAKKEAAAVLSPLGLPLDRPSAEKALAFLAGVHARNMLRAWLTERLPAGFTPDRTDAGLLRQVDAFRGSAALLARVDSANSFAPFRALFRAELPRGGEALAALLERSAASARSIAGLLAALRATALLAEPALEALSEKALHGRPIDDDAAKLREDAERLEPLLRFEAEVAPFPAAVGESLKMLARSEQEEELAWRRLLAGSLAGALERLLRERPLLQRCDATRIEGNFLRLRELTGLKMALEAERIQARWVRLQRERLLASTGSRLSSPGADLRRRLMLRGRQASRIRQVVFEGRSIAGGDPLFDVHPVWMTSPETATLIFPAEPIFDVVIFDEASQCRLEEGLPVLLRGQNVVIAGDTKQLPPTRFFESSVAASDAAEDEDGGAEGLFQAQQSEIEDLLSAALNIEVEQAYLDVHYRSRNADLIEFSNASFYGSRLQAIPAHPNANPSHTPPILLTPVQGICEERQNPIEAEALVRRVQELLRGEAPPSIGIVSFNLTQKDLIEEKLDAAAEADPEFRARLSAARSRERQGAFEGLFVKNLENVQGDERDVILISTTYGPNAQGKFYRRFGPLARAGGERRLNVIVTRARERVEIFTSIPGEVYRSEAGTEAPPGTKPNGAWFLMKYLRDAELLAEVYAKAAEREDEQEDADGPPATCERFASAAPSQFVEAFAALLMQNHGIASLVYYGNDGFAVDLAFRHPNQPGKVTIGVLLDGTRYPRAQDRVEWDGFKRVVLESQKWELYRVWTPQFLRDPAGTVARLVEAARRLGEKDN